jgi:hypothetical protein
MKYRTVLFRLIACLCAAAVLISSAQAAEMPPVAIAELKRQASALDRVYLEYTESQSGIDLPDYYGGSSACLAYFDNISFYGRSDLHYKEGNEHQINEYAFDGEHFYSGGWSYKTLVKYLPSDKTDPQRLDPIHIRYFPDAGFQVPQSIADLQDLMPIQSLVLHYLSKGNKASVKDEGGLLSVTFEIPDPQIVHARAVDLEKERRKLLKLKNGPDFAEERIAELRRMQTQPPNRKVVFSLDSARGYGVASREEYTADGQLILRAQNKDWQKHGKVGVWLPHTSVVDYYADRFALKNFSDTVRLTVTYQVKQIDFNWHKEISFNLAKTYVQPGTTVFDRSLAMARGHPDHAVVSHVAADGSLLRGAAVKASGQMNWKSRYVLIPMIVLLCVPLVIIAARRTAKKVNP